MNNGVLMAAPYYLDFFEGCSESLFEKFSDKPTEDFDYVLLI